MTDTKEAVAESTTPTTFDFAAAISDRSYPEFDVEVFLDEKRVHELIRIAVERNEVMKRAAGGGNLNIAERLEELDKRHEEVRESLRGSRHIVHIKGVAPEVLREASEEALAKYPIEYEEHRNSISGLVTKTEIPNPERDQEEVMRIRQAHIVSVTAPNGAVDSDWSDLDKLSVVFTRLPFMARDKIDEAINSCTITVDYYRELVDEVF